MCINFRIAISLLWGVSWKPRLKSIWNCSRQRSLLDAVSACLMLPTCVLFTCMLPFHVHLFQSIPVCMYTHLTWKGPGMVYNSQMAQDGLHIKNDLPFYSNQHVYITIVLSLDYSWWRTAVVWSAGEEKNHCLDGEERRSARSLQRRIISFSL